MNISPQYPIPTVMGIVTITPEMAQDWLARLNVGNRNISLPQVKKYATAMKEGRWSLTHQGIGFDSEGFLFDGQHRLHAIVESQCPTECLVVPNCDRSTFSKVDAGKVRGAWQFVNHSYAGMIAAAARFTGAVDGTLRRYANSGVFVTQVDTDEVLSVVDAWPELILYARAVHECYRAAKITQAPHLAVLAQAARSPYSERIDEWIDGLTGGAGLASDDPRLHLRNRFTRDRPSNGTSGRVLSYELIVTAWNAWAVKKPMKLLRKGSQIPAVVGTNFRRPDDEQEQDRG